MEDENSRDNLEPPENDWRDYGYSALRAGLSLIPFAGGAAAELLQFVLQPSLEKRRMEWMRMVGEAIVELQKNQGVRLDDLRTNEIFIDTMIRATHIVYRTSQDEKRRALKNMIINSALPSAPDQSLQQIYLNWVDTFTVWHLRLLKLFDNPPKWAEENNHRFPQIQSGGLSHIIESAYSELVNQRAFYDVIWRDLYQQGAIGPESPHGMMTARGLMEKRTTDLGTRFLHFIESPQ